MKEASYQTTVCEECGAKYSPEIANDECPCCGTIRSVELSMSEMILLMRDLQQSQLPVDVEYDYGSNDIVVTVNE